MGLGIQIFKLTQTRHALALRHSGILLPELAVALDYLLTRFDSQLEAAGHGRSDLRWRLREWGCVGNNLEELKILQEQKRQEGVTHKEPT